MDIKPIASYRIARVLISCVLIALPTIAIADHRERDDNVYRVDPREYRGDWRRNESRNDFEDRRDDRNHWGPPRWQTLAQLRTYVDGRAQERILLPRGTTSIRLAARKRHTEIISAFLELPDGREVRLAQLEGQLDGDCDTQVRVPGRWRGAAVLHLQFASGRDGRRAYFDVLAGS